MVRSSWLIPSPRSRYPKEDLNLWWAVYDPAGGWCEDERFYNHQSRETVGLGEWNGRLVCLHRGGNDQYLWYTVYDPETG
ncbi:hypothetical protein [Streptomyces sp. NPDC001828]|uniref:hypothetical protein n=1 Tax=Streptomyces sp. NPDC001828 TaxID=3364615 RepID=UPI00368012D4